MIHNERFIEGYTIHATDGELGKVDAFLFDDEKWVVRYLVVDTRKWLFGRKVLISPISIQDIHHEEEHISVDLTKEQVKDSPDIDTEQPVSREQEAKVNMFFDWGSYWGEPGIWGSGVYPAELAQQEAMEMAEEEGPESHVRKTSEVIGYEVADRDSGPAGEVDNFLIDDETWKIRYVLIRFTDGEEERIVPVEAERITGISWPDKKVHASIERSALPNAPTYNPEKPFDDDFKRKVHDAFAGTGTMSQPDKE
ncbi:PRC-barrel domain-containing protein [Halobacillus salinus]|uniref:PRC-barrel domain-containing protein n=1 Tax=Halobacillus salinus TaxID=192814 RepID=UPI0009A7D621|nr:PRC-barrel domain-containing protein [Halobacillus salinus]